MTTQRRRTLMQAAFLVLFAGLAVTGRLQLWMGILLAGVVAAPFAGRFYCGWVCPWNTLQEVGERIRRRLRWPARPVPAWSRAPWIRHTILGVFLMVLVGGMAIGRQVPLLLLLLPLAVGLVFFYVRALWHRRLCPFGVLFSLVASRPRRRLVVDGRSCNGCGICVRRCPAEGVALTDDKSQAGIDPRFCLECRRCFEACPQDAIQRQAGAA